MATKMGSRLFKGKKKSRLSDASDVMEEDSAEENERLLIDTDDRSGEDYIHNGFSSIPKEVSGDLRIAEE
jgi:hypothetical protein